MLARTEARKKALSRGRNMSGATSDATLVKLWLNGKSQATQKTYEGILRRFFAHVGKPLAEVTLLDLQFYGDALQSRGLHANSIKLHQMCIKSLLAFGAKTGYLRYDVGRAWQGQRVSNALTGRILTEAEVLRLIDAAKRPRDRALLELLYKTGMRVSEVAGLDWEAIRPDGRGAVVRVQGKGQKVRFVRIPQGLWERLRMQNPKATGPVFASQKGHRLSVRQIQLMLKALAVRALGKGISPHWLRHCHATHCLRRGMAVVDVAAVLGHANISTTSRYLHANPDICPADYLPE